jgi:mRNA-degrading endonuclease RelE of RelBE toxin-antitoxin system
MNYHLILKPSAQKQLENLADVMQRRIVQKIEQIETEPRMSGSVKLAGGRNTYRVRVGATTASFTRSMTPPGPLS